MLKISNSAVISKLADIEDSKRGSVIEISDKAVIDSFVKIKPAGGDGNLYIGASSYINSGVVIYLGNGVHIGSNVAIAANCTLAPVNHQFESKVQKIVEQKFMPGRGGIIIEDDVWIGANCIILDGAVIRTGAVVGAGSLVNKELPPYSVSFGSPAVVKKYRG